MRNHKIMYAKILYFRENLCLSSITSFSKVSAKVLIEWSIYDKPKTNNFGWRMHMSDDLTLGDVKNQNT